MSLRDDEWEALGRFIAGESDDAERSRIAAELAASPERAALVAALKEAGVPRAISVTPDETEAALAAVLARRGLRVERGTRSATPRRAVVAERSWWRDPRVKAAAAVVVVAGASLLWRSADHRSDGVAPAVAQILRTGVGQVDSLRLRDGSRVILGPSSQLETAAGYGTTTRELTLRGEGYFDVVHDSNRPFTVHTTTADLRDVGTMFSVHDLGGSDIRVTVAEGAVAVRALAGSNRAADTLVAGDRGRITREGAMQVEHGVAGSQDLGWTVGRLVLRDAPVGELTAELRRWYGIELRVDDPTIASRRLTATFEGSSRQDVARVVAAALGGVARQVGDTLWIVPSFSPASRR